MMAAASPMEVRLALRMLEVRMLEVRMMEVRMMALRMLAAEVAVAVVQRGSGCSVAAASVPKQPRCLAL
jgi:hypothetical protein